MSRAPARALADIGDALFSADVSLGLGNWIGGGLLAEEDVRQRFQAPLFGDGRPGAAFGPVRLINIFERGEGLGFGDGVLELIGEEIAFGEGFQDRVPALIQFREAQEPFANAGDGHFVQRSGGFLAIPGDEGDRGALGEKLGGGGDLPGLHFELARNLKNMCFVHFKTDRLLYPSAACRKTKYARSQQNSNAVQCSCRPSSKVAFVGQNSHTACRNFMSGFVIGQRWISESEPELGLATVVHTGSGRVRVEFESAGEARTYAAEQAPLKRVRFRAGDKVRTREDQEFLVKEVIEQQGLLIYVGENQRLPEAQLSDRLSLRGPQERLFAGRFDTSAAFELRRRTLDLLHRSRKSPVRGFLGGRIDLIPHQLYIAQEVANRHAARVMLSDEVGLGKTIEACLILHRLLLSGRANRILVLVPESLVHQWFVEMLRRFNVWLHIFDEERCASIEAGEPGANPFLDDQLVLTSIGFLAADPRRSAQAVAAGWDVLVVDEAHHLEWSEASPSRAYQVVDELSRKSEGLLLLTATPEQLGVESHFARLRLLDPDRYRDLATFQAEAKDYRATAEVAEKLLAEKELTGKDLALLRRLLAPDAELEPRLAELGKGNTGGETGRAGRPVGFAWSGPRAVPQHPRRHEGLSEAHRAPRQTGVRPRIGALAGSRLHRVC